MSERPDYTTCIQRGGDPRHSWCRREVSTLFHFATIEHAALTQLSGDRLRVCPECRDAVMKALSCQEETAIKGHPLAKSAGRFKDDPFWESMMAAIENNRRELDAEYNTSE